MDANETITVKHLQRMKNISFKTGLRNGLRTKVEEKGFDVDALHNTVNTAAVDCYGTSVEGLCMKNNSGGYYFFSEKYTPSPIFLKKEGSVVVNASTRPTKICCLFWDMFDYMAYRTLYKQDLLHESIPYYCDCIIIGTTENFVSAMLDCECYEKIYMLLPNTEFGRTMTLTISSPEPTPCRNRHNCIDMSGLFREYDSLYDFMKSTSP